MKRRKIYSITEAAQLLGLTRSGVYDAIKSGRLKAVPREVKRIVWEVDAQSVDQYKVSRSHQVRGKKSGSSKS